MLHFKALSGIETQEELDKRLTAKIITDGK